MCVFEESLEWLDKTSILEVNNFDAFYVTNVRLASKTMAFLTLYF